MEAVLSEVVAVEDLLKFEKKYNAEVGKGTVSKSTQFEYAWCLIRSKYGDDIRKGILLLEVNKSNHLTRNDIQGVIQLKEENNQQELLPKGNKEEQRDYVFYLSVANYRQKEYEKALKYVRNLLKTEPKNTQALELEKLIEKAMQKDGLVGMAIIGGMALGVAGLAGLIGLAVAKSK
ncbi:mitochondrial fission 1 protein isoform X1 [Rhinatrema bivittatum]|uniref:mitochondrial fission 1 protein isoform X1 n=1 Tax=Rhinatrema bivittatum TaxID=194408 RepID=UPI001126C9A7|nr:mitochondrial fission 1 protein isoform X1 [Rhinatrema bivittatum]